MLLRIFTEPQIGATYDDLLAIAKATEDGGFDAFFRSDHYMAFGGEGLPGSTDAWITLAGLARETSRIRLGTLVSPVTFRMPGPLAISVAQVDQMSGGRVDLGLGTGWFDREHSAYGIPFPVFGQRFELLEEQLEVLTGLWRTPVGERFSFAGDYYKVEDSPALPKPAQDGGPPIIIGGAGPKRTPRIAARWAAEYNVPFYPLEAVGEAFDRARAACERVERDPSTLVLSSAQTVCCGADEAEIERRAKVIGRSVEDLRQNAVCGTPAEVVDRIGAFAEKGATRFYLQVLDLRDLDHVALLAAEVLPAVSA